MSSSCRFLFKIGCLVLLAPVAIAITLVALHQIGIVNFWIFPLGHISVFCVFGGASCIAVAKIGERKERLQAQLLVRHKFHKSTLQWKQKLGWGLAILVLSLNLSTYFFAYYLTHVRVPGQLGIGVPKPRNDRTPSDRGLPYTTAIVPTSQSERLEIWEIPAQTSNYRGSVLLFPGNLGTKSSQLLAPAQSFVKLGFDAVLVDFRGVGGSSGNTTTLGIREAKDVVALFNYLKTKHEKEGNNTPIVLYGVSMGSAAILRAISLDGIEPNAIILELPFTRLIDAIESRLRFHGIPTFPTAPLLIFWAGIQHGFNGFSHNPIDFAKDVKCPTLVIHGKQDKWMKVDEIETLVGNIPRSKQLVVSPNAGHHQLIGVDRPLWNSTIDQFLRRL